MNWSLKFPKWWKWPIINLTNKGKGNFVKYENLSTDFPNRINLVSSRWKTPFSDNIYSHYQFSHIKILSLVYEM